jgi:hypothetical protein
MVADPSNIQELRTRLEVSRWQLYEGIQRLEDRLNVPLRIQTQLAEHPVKWAAVSLGAGIVTAKATPFLLRAMGTGKLLRAAVLFGLSMLVKMKKAAT